MTHRQNGSPKRFRESWQKRLYARLYARLYSSYGAWAIVTGASSGIGREISIRLAEAGLNLLIPLPRWVRVRIMGRVMEGMTKHQCTNISDLAEVK